MPNILVAFENDKIVLVNLMFKNTNERLLDKEI